MPSNLHSESESESDADADADDNDDTRSTVSRASTTFSQRAIELEEINRKLEQKAVADTLRMAQLEAALAASQLTVAQGIQAREAEAAAKRQAEAQALTERTVAAEAKQGREAAERQIAEERRAREVTEQAANETRIALARAEAGRVAAEHRNTQLLAQQQLELQRIQEAERQRVAQEAAAAEAVRQAALPIGQQPFAEQVRRVQGQPQLVVQLSQQQWLTVVPNLTPQQRAKASMALCRAAGL